ncbi:hypothetical protein GF348_24250, partial [candidate division KSB3 bacterium]|nr:hypothetical protein [candidate division KSB3 bacterium]
MQDIITIDFREIVRDLGEHYDPADEQTLTAQCPRCAEEGRVVQIFQDNDKCFRCETPVVWRNSKMWKSIYGSPTQRIRDLRAIAPSTTSGKTLIEGAGLAGWKTQVDANTWQRAVKMFGETEMARAANYVLKDKTGNPAVAHAINIAKAKIRSGKRDEKPKKRERKQDG